MDIRAILAGLAFAFIWSSAFTSARIIVETAPPMLSLGLRFFISGAIAVGLARMLGQSWALTPAQWRATVVFGVCQNALYLGLNFVAMQTVEASLASIIASTMPLIVGAATIFILRERLSALGIAGLAAGLMGVCLIMGLRMSGGADLYGVVLCVIGVLSLAIATMTVRVAMSGGNMLMIIGLQMLVGAVILASIGMMLETWNVVWTPRLITAFSYTVVFPGLIATFIWFWLVQRIGAVKAATFHFLNPFFGVAVAAMLLGESLGLWDFVGVAIIMLGILAVQIARQSGK